MSELVVVGFKQDKDRAAAVLSELRAADEPWTANFRGAIAAYRDADGRLIVDQSYESTKGGRTISGGMLGALAGFALAALALPITAGISGLVAGGSLVAGMVGGTFVGAEHGAAKASWWKEDLGIPEAFLASIREMIQQPDSAIFILLHAPDPDDLAARFRPFGGTVLRSQLTPDQHAQLLAAT
jgi:uncharacterized membrane protein